MSALLRLQVPFLGLAAWTLTACTLTSDLASLSAGGAPATEAGGEAGTGGRGGEPSDGGAGATGGAPEAPKCDSPVQCEPPDTKCQVPACIGGVCGQAAVPPGQEVVGEQAPGDCSKIVCDGGGAKESIEDAADVPDDLNPCTSDECNGGTPAHSNMDDATVCGMQLGCLAGQCVGCTMPSQCPDASTSCATPTCSMAAVCGFDYQANNTPVPDPQQQSGDCQIIVCNGMGLELSSDDPSDKPPSDGSDCTVAACVAGAPAQIPTAEGSPCSRDGVVCDGFGKCIGCIVDGIKNYGETGVDCGGPQCDIRCINGTPCSNAEECASGFCTDGVCCNSTCLGECVSCNPVHTGGLGGKCKPVLDGLNPNNECGANGLCVDGRCLMMMELP